MELGTKVKIKGGKHDGKHGEVVPHPSRVVQEGIRIAVRLEDDSVTLLAADQVEEDG